MSKNRIQKKQREIKEHCSGADSKDLIKCLKDFSHDNSFDQKCLEILNKRIVQHSQDFRLNPSLKKFCHRDIKKFCSDIINSYNENEGSMEGQVINCLKHNALQKQRLTETCMKEVVLTMVDAAQLVGADPVLERVCPQTLVNCKSVHHSDKEINECLKEMFKKGGITDGEDCVQHVAEIIEATGADIHTDPALNNACAVDLRKFCRDITPGEGRMFACLVAVSKEKSFTLESECRSILSKRIEMFGLAVKVHLLSVSFSKSKSIFVSGSTS